MYTLARCARLPESPSKADTVTDQAVRRRPFCRFYKLVRVPPGVGYTVHGTRYIYIYIYIYICIHVSIN